MFKLKTIWNLPRVSKRIISVFVDSVFIVCSYYAAHWARLGDLMWLPKYDNEAVLLGTWFLTIVAFTKLGLYRAVLRYLTFHALYVVSLGTIISTISIALLAYYFNSAVPRSVPIIYGAFLALSCGGVRLIVRTLFLNLFRKVARTYSSMARVLQVANWHSLFVTLKLTKSSASLTKTRP